MRKYGVIHYSDNWCYGPAIKTFATQKEQRDYVKDFRGNRYHKKDSIELIEITSTHDISVADQTERETLYGFKVK